MTPVPSVAADLGLDPVAATAIADELVHLTSVLSALAYDLGSDAATVRRHMSSLQAIDLITQVQLALANILRSDAPIAVRLKQVPVEALGQRLRARILNDLPVHPMADGSSSDQDTVFL